MQDIKKNKKIETIKEEVNESNNTKQNNNSDIQDIVNEDYNGNNNIKE